MKYAVITENITALSCLLEYTSNYIANSQGVDFEASWVLVARWVDVCPYTNNTCTEVSES